MIAATTATSIALATCHVGPKAVRRCTPGAVQSSDAKAICTPGWASAHRNVSSSERDAVRASYGAPHVLSPTYPQPGSWEVDHLVPLELGGANTPANLWPQKWPGFSTKDNEEDALHAAVCSGQMTLRAAVAKIIRDWRTK